MGEWPEFDGGRGRGEIKLSRALVGACAVRMGVLRVHGMDAHTLNDVGHGDGGEPDACEGARGGLRSDKLKPAGGPSVVVVL